MDSMFYPNCPFEIDGCKVYYKSTADKLCNITIDNDISQIMIERAQLVEDINMFGESSKIFKPWEIHPLKDLWFYFNRITHKGEMQDKKGNVQTKFKLRNLKQSLEEGVNDPDFFRYIYGNKLTNCKYYNDLYRLFYWAAIEPNLEMKQELANKFANQKEFARGSAVLLFHYNIPGAVKALQRLQNEKDQLQVNAFEEIESLLRFLQSFAGIHQRVFFGLQKVLKSPELVKIVLSSSFDDFDFYSKTESIEKGVLAEAIEIRGMLKMMVMQLKSTKYTDEYMNLIKDFLCRDINVKGILMCQKISITDRLPFLIRFAPEQLLACVEECVKEAIEKGYLEFIMMLEDESEIVDLVQAYLDRSHDIQTAAIVGLKLLSVKLVTTEINVNKISQWYKNYQRFLNKNQLFTERTNTDEKKIEIFKNCLNISKEEQTKATELYFYCWNCKNPYSLTQYLRSKKQGKDIEKINKESSMSSKQFVSNCVCSKPTPFCAICYLPISFANPVQKMMEKLRMNPKTMSGAASTRQAEPKDDKKFATFDQ